MSTTNKGFIYVFNISSEDHKVSKVLSGMKVNDTVPLVDLTPFDTHTQQKIARVQARLFGTFSKLNTVIQRQSARH